MIVKKMNISEIGIKFLASLKPGRAKSSMITEIPKPTKSRHGNRKMNKGLAFGCPQPCIMVTR